MKVISPTEYAELMQRHMPKFPHRPDYELWAALGCFAIAGTAWLTSIYFMLK